MTQSIDSARLTLILNDLRLPAIKQGWSAFGRTGGQGRMARPRFLAALASTRSPNATVVASSAISPTHACFPARPSSSFDFDAVPMISKAHVMAICAGDNLDRHGRPISS